MFTLNDTIEQAQAATTKPKAIVESVPTPYTRSSTLQDGVQRRLVCMSYSANYAKKIIYTCYWIARRMLWQLVPG